MEDNRRTTHSVDDYYPSRPGTRNPSQENLSNCPTQKTPMRTTPVPTAQIPMVLMRMLPMKNSWRWFSDNSRDEDPYGQSSHSSDEGMQVGR